jgi:hypothetical protein
MEHTSTRTISPPNITTRWIRTPTIVMPKFDDHPITRLQHICNLIKPSFPSITSSTPPCNRRVVHIGYTGVETIVEILAPTFSSITTPSRSFGAVPAEVDCWDFRSRRKMVAGWCRKTRATADDAGSYIWSCAGSYQRRGCSRSWNCRESRTKPRRGLNHCPL